MSESAVAAAMSAETWYGAQEAKAAGFCDDVLDAVGAEALARHDLRPFGYRNASSALAKTVALCATPPRPAAKAASWDKAIAEYNSRFDKIHGTAPAAAPARLGWDKAVEAMNGRVCARQQDEALLRAPAL